MLQSVRKLVHDGLIYLNPHASQSTNITRCWYMVSVDCAQNKMSVVIRPVGERTEVLLFLLSVKNNSSRPPNLGSW